MDSSSSKTGDRRETKQHVIVMRHGDRIDNAEPLWVTTAARPWDPPLVESGRERAFCTGRKFRNSLGFPIHRVFVSPFLRCIQTASEVVTALCAVDDNDPLRMTGDGVSIDPSKVKVSVEYGLCELFSQEAIRIASTPKDGEWGFNISEAETMLPAGTVDRTVGHVDQELPKWGEPILEARARYVRVLQALADKFPTENLLLVTHGEGVGAVVSAFLKEVTVYEVEYCAYSHQQRQISFDSNQTFTAGNFKVVTKNLQSGVRFCLTNELTCDL